MKNVKYYIYIYIIFEPMNYNILDFILIIKKKLLKTNLKKI